MDSRKQAMSIRMSASDVRNIKRLAKRLGVRDSDIVRYAVKTILAKLLPLSDASVRGTGLVPVFVESDTELFRHFELDALRLETIINDGVETERRVDPDDIQLIAMHGSQQPYAKLRLNNLSREVVNTSADPVQSLKDYLYTKYVYSAAAINGTRPEI